jgi:hypothetical protein
MTTCGGFKNIEYFSQPILPIVIQSISNDVDWKYRYNLFSYLQLISSEQESIQVQLSFKETVFSTSSEHRLLDDIIRDIKEGVYEELVGKIRAEQDKEIRYELKKGLPVLFIGVVFRDNKSSFNNSESVASTGIIQFDFDEYDLEKSRKFQESINNHPSVLYSFISPSGGVKFGVMTDFDCNDKKSISQKYSEAYNIAKEDLAVLLEGYTLDDSLKSISKQCYLSHDQDAYDNPDAKKLIINKRVSEICIEEKEQRKIHSENRTSLTRNTDDAEVLEALSCIPSQLKYEERMIINFAVISQFGVNSKPVLMSHWAKGDKKKLEQQIDSQIKSHMSSKSGISVSTLFYEAMKHGYRGNRIIQKTDDEPTFNYEKYYTPDESSIKLEEIILVDFFENRKDKMVNVECGSGKTRTMFKVITNFLIKNPHIKVSVFLKTHEMMDQFVRDMNENIKSYNQSQVEKCGISGMRDQYPFNHMPLRIKGMGEACKEIDREGSGITRDNIGIIGTSKCDDCFYQNIESCEYFDQFDKSLENMSNVRVYSHNRLFIRPKIDREFKPDYVVIDEDIVPMMIDTDESLLSINESEHASIAHILGQLRNGQTLSDSMMDAPTSFSENLSKDYNTVKTELDNLIRQISGFASGALRQQQANQYRELQKNISTKKKMKLLFEELLLLSSGTKLRSKNVWVQHREDESPRLTYGRSKKILDEYKDIPMLYLDGSGEQSVIESLFDKDFDFENIRVEQQENAKVFQFKNRASFSKQSFSMDTAGKKIDEICDWIDTLETDSIGLIRYHKINGDKAFFNKLDEKIKQINDGDDLVGWFGNIRGVNRFQNCDTLIVLGQHRLPDYEIFNLSQLIFRRDVLEANEKLDLESYADYLKKEETTKAYRMKNGHHRNIKQAEYLNPECYLTSMHFDKAETYQALHRLRLIHGTEYKQVFILSDAVLDVSIDELLDRYKELGDKNRAVIKHLKDNKFLIDSNASFIETFGWNEGETSEFRKQRGSGEWMKNHCSLLYWRYEAKDRTVGNVFSWKNQTADDVQSWLETRMIPVKSLKEQST